ncbi:MAG TPA: peptidylprolyl isomerase [Flavobacterium sp.]|nr:peptidylprolyl isomerase [Flavobacterium sp.]
MKLKFVFLLLFTMQLNVAFSQELKNNVLFTINNKPFYTDEFVRVYNKNLDLVKDESQKDINVYFEMFLGYKLKVEKAYKLGLHEKTTYKDELKTYRTQLSKNYTTDSKVTDALVKEAYQRYLKEIRASHILIKLDENATPADTLKAFNQIKKIKDEITNGLPFGEAAANYSEDLSAKENKGDLGYFSAFTMVYPFESVAYSTPKGAVSKPFRTRFGYHLLYVPDVKDNRGEVTVSHIMVAEKNNDEEKSKNKSLIEDIYQKLLQGEKFEALARQFSDDKSSAENGGLIKQFGVGDLSSPEFENEAFELKKPNDISKPFKTQFGWHIIKLKEKHPVKTFEECKNEFGTKILRDDRSKLISNSITEKLKKKYPVSTDKKIYEALKKTVNDTYYKQTWQVTPEVFNSFEKKLLVINNDQVVNGTNFIQYLQQEQKQELQIKPIHKLVDFIYNKFIEVKLNEYYNANLENEFPDFKYIMNEYRDGLLLFDLMEKEIWERSKTDTVGQKKFYLNNIKNYQWKERFDVDIFSSTNESELKKALKLLKKGTDILKIKETINNNGKVNIIVQSGVYENESKALPKTIKPVLGLSTIAQEGDYFYFLNTKKILPIQPKEFSEAKGRVISDYQNYLEQNWVSDLKSEVNIQINKNILEQLKQQFKK